MKNKIVLLLFLSLSSVIQGQYTPFDTPQRVLDVLSIAKTNHAELEKVLPHYVQKNDTLGWQMACFLLENLYCHYGEWYYWRDTLNQKVDFDEFSFPTFNRAVAYFNNYARGKKLRPVPRRSHDLYVIQSDYLIKYIDRAVARRNTPWLRSLSFDNYCRYFLPYRGVIEPLSDWEEGYKAYFDTIVDRRLPLDQNVTRICESINKSFTNTYRTVIKREPQAYLSASQVIFRRRGGCEDMCLFTLFALRSQGIASTIDFTPAWGTSSGCHYWNVYLDENNHFVPFYAETGHPSHFLLNREPSKVIRYSYGREPEALRNVLKWDMIPNGYMRMWNIKDVTDEYWRTGTLTCKLKENCSDTAIYASVFNSGRWEPVFYTFPYGADTAVFTKMCCNVVYLPTYFDRKYKINVPAGNPVLLRDDGTCTELAMHPTEKLTITIPEKENYLMYRYGKKYTFFYWLDKRWVQAGEIIYNGEKNIRFKNIPKGTLYRLRPEYALGKERIFTLKENGELEYW